MKRVLIFIDNSKRDLLTARLLEVALNKLEIKTRLCNWQNCRVHLRDFKPHAFIASRGDFKLARIASECCKIFIVPSEGAYQTKETMLSVFMGRGYWKLDKTNWISKCYLWSQNTYDWLIESGMFQPAQLKVTGNVRLDVYRSGLFKRKEGGEFVLGIAFSAKSTSTYLGSPRYAENYFNIDPRWNHSFVVKGGYLEDVTWRDHAILRNSMQALKQFLETMNGRVLFRPGPFEDPKEYMFLEKRYRGRVGVLPNQPLAEWLSDIDAMLTCWSTTGLEALILGIPVISIGGIINPERLFNHINARASGFETFVKFYYLPQNKDELFELIKLSANRQLAPSPKSTSDVNKLLFDLYNWPTEKSVAETIAKDIKQELEKSTEFSKKHWKREIPFKYGAPLCIAKIAYFIKAIYEDLKTGAFKSCYDFHRTWDPRVEKIIKLMKKNKILQKN